MKAGTLKLLVATTAFAFTLAACSSDEVSGGENHTPESVKLFDTETNTELSPLELPSGTTTRVTVHFYNAEGEDISQELIETGHFTSLTFTPVSFATAGAVAGQVFQRDVAVTGDPGATATVVVGYGHDEAADTRTFGPYTATAIEGAPAARAAFR